MDGRRLAAAIAVIALAGCGGEVVPYSDTSTDTATDVPADTGLDTVSDTAPDSPMDVPGDSIGDTGEDITGDTPADVPSDTDACDGGCMLPLLCCDERCVNPAHDPDHCGGCDSPCTGHPPFCDGGACGTAPCMGVACPSGSDCCGADCCSAGQVCCVVEESVMAPVSCHDDVCPPGCPWCA